MRPNLHANSSSNAITPPTPPTLATAGVIPNNNQQQRAANVTNLNVLHSNMSTKNTISISPVGSGIQPQLEIQLPHDGTQHMLQLPHFSTQFQPGSGATFVPLSNSIHPASGAFDHLTLEDHKPDLGQLCNQQQSQNAIVYPSEDGQHLGSIPGGGNQNMAQQGGTQVKN